LQLQGAQAKDEVQEEIGVERAEKWGKGNGNGRGKGKESRNAIY